MACDCESSSSPHNTISWWWWRQQTVPPSASWAEPCIMCFVFITSSSLHNKPMRSCQRNHSSESCDPRMLLGANKFLAIYQTKPPSLQGTSFPSPPPPPTHSLCTHLEAWFVCLLIAALRPAVTRQLGSPAPAQSTGWVFVCGCDTLKVGESSVLLWKQGRM